MDSYHIFILKLMISGTQATLYFPVMVAQMKIGDMYFRFHILTLVLYSRLVLYHLLRLTWYIINNCYIISHWHSYIRFDLVCMGECGSELI